MYSNLRQWKRIRKRVLKLGESQRQVALMEGIGRRTVRKMLMTEFPPGYKGRNLHNSSIQEEDQVHAPTACCSKSSRSKQRWMEWIYTNEHQPFEKHRDIGIGDSFDGLTYSQNRMRKKILTVLAADYGFSVSAIAVHLGITRRVVRRYLAEFKAGGTTQLLGRKLIGRKADDPALKTALFALLHEPPSLSGFNRTTWRLMDLHKEMARRGHPACGHVISEVIKDAGYRWRSARVVLTSNDPDYREKLNQIRNILSHLKGDERFFSIDEFGPFAIKVKGGRILVEPGVQPTVPQWQKSKGRLIVTAALELSGNRITHFYSKAKNTTEMIKMAKQLIYRRKPPALPGRLPEFDVSWILQHPIPGVGILTVTDCGQAPLRGQQS